ncbi:MAG: hypothetical protein KGI27_15675, partial [Thaumarchaeota archaeon]|nr:hypothetical protein [Nitrososphaerota archaeon]
AVTYGFFPVFVSHRGLPGLPTAFPYTLAYFLGTLTTSFFAAGIALLVISCNKSNEWYQSLRSQSHVV